jgi:hypothetical protein
MFNYTLYKNAGFWLVNSRDIFYEKKLNLMQIYLHEVKILQIHNSRPEFVKNITAINQSESSILI